MKNTVPQKPEEATSRKIHLRVLSQYEEETARNIVNAAYDVHKELGAGLLERVYKSCFCYELLQRGCDVKRQVDVPIVYHGMRFSEGLRLDVLVNDIVICELKAVDEVNPVCAAQILSHMKITGKHPGFLINFNVPPIKDGIRRFIR